jgi:peptidoglycan/LPS O-acetylase OafA/YrhL
MHAIVQHDHATSPSIGAAERNAPIDALRAFVTLLVIAHHALIAYMPDLPPPAAAFNAPPMSWMAFPVVDAQKFAPFGLLVMINDLFFMALMFFISGLFVWTGLSAKRAGGFLKGRALRLGVPFVLAVALLAPLAYAPAYLATGAEPSLPAFARAWLSLPYWPSGPAWFLWVLLAFGAVAALVHAIAPTAFERLGRLTGGADRRPGRVFLALVVLSAAVYIPATMVVYFGAWLHVGPFLAQTSRLGLYAVYFFAGIAVGTWGLGRGLTDPGGALPRRWWQWLLAAVPAVIAILAVMIMAMGAKGQPKPLWDVTGGLAFATACAALSFAALAAFLRFTRRQGPIGASLGANAYGMYLTHYVFVTWLQYALLDAPMNGLAKGLTVLAGAVALSWLTTMVLRRTPLLGRIL